VEASHEHNKTGIKANGLANGAFTLRVILLGEMMGALVLKVGSKTSVKGR
jgi:hypothetical protein